MSVPIGAMAAWFATPSMSPHQRPGQSVWGDAETGQQRAFASFQRGGLGSAGRRWHSHLIVIIQSDNQKNNNKSKCCDQARWLQSPVPKQETRGWRSSVIQ